MSASDPRPPIQPEPREAGREQKGIPFHGRRQEPLPPPLTGLAPGALLGEFRLVRPIGEGGMGQVWEAEQTSLRRRVALKLVRPDRLTQKTLELFAREARAGGRLQHAGLVNVYGHGESGGVAWIAMELVEGAWSLRDFIDEVAREPELPPTYYRDVAAFVAKIADALQAAHEGGVIHRDLKPHNVLITPQDEPKVTDFGLARITDETSLSVSGELAGTYYYMSPEQVLGRRVELDHRSDVFSLGVVLYEMLALRRPFEGDTGAQISQQILNSDPPDLVDLRSRIPRDLAVICGKCLAKERERRYPSMAELAADLRRQLANLPIRARPPTAWECALQWSKRNPTKSAAGAVAACAFVVISLLLAENVRARAEVERKNVALDSAIGDLAEQTRAARAAATAERARLEEVLRLSALQDHDELLAWADRLWPAHPEHIAPYTAWVEEARRLVADLPLHRAKRDALRGRALPRTAQEREADVLGSAEHGRILALRAEIGSRRAALLQRRAGVAAPLSAGDWASLPADADALLALAAPEVDPERSTFGGEAGALVLAQRALELAEEAGDDRLVARAQQVLSHACFALGRDEEALEAASAALILAPSEERERWLAELERVAAEQRGEGAFAEAERRIALLEAELSAAEARASEQRSWRFPETEEGREDRWWHANLTRLIGSLEQLQDERSGLFSASPAAVSPEHGWSVPRRLALALRLREGFAPGGAWHERWQRAIEAVRENARYGGLVLRPQMGLVPIGPDPDSGLWEFWHVASGAEPERDPAGRLRLDEESGIVLVLVPGGSFWMGAQARDPRGQNHDPRAQEHDGPVHEVELGPYFLAKHELSQGQWLRASGTNPSYYQENELAPTLLHPVEQVSWFDCTLWLSRLGLCLPSEAQWEHGCRAGTSTPWWTGAERESLREKRAANLADQTAARGGATWPEVHDWPELDDGYAVHAPIGTFAPNAFGLHDTAGNLWEWCRDGYDAGFYARSTGKDPECPASGSAARIIRGGSFLDAAANARSATRSNPAPSLAGHLLGLRAARTIL